MLKEVTIRNYALIDQLDIRFGKGFSVITGETGAGKSIILGALALALGQRAEGKIIKEGAEKCIIEVEFDITGYPLQNFFDENELDYQESCVIRREVLSNGKSRSFINDTPIGIAQLKELGSQLIDIHSQHENLLLNNPLFQLNIIDIVAKNNKLLSEYQIHYKAYRELKNALSELIANAEKVSSEKDFLQFHYTQLYEAHLEEDEQNLLEDQLKILNHTEEIKSGLSQAIYFLQEDQGILPLLKETIQAYKKALPYLSDGSELDERLSSCYIDLKDITQELNIRENSIEFDPEKIENIQQRLDLIYTLQKKHKVSTTAELISLKKHIEKQLSQIESFDQEITSLEEAIREKEILVKTYAENLSVKRQQAIPNIIQEVCTLLRELGMPHIQFDIILSKKAEWSPSGNDEVQILFSANKNSKMQAVTQIASGGEISRLMLSLKSLIANTNTLPTIIFDEIDTGVSGHIADKMADIMKKMSENMQVISITHLPQIAAKGTGHYKVFKNHEGNTTTTDIKALSGDERVLEIAQMLSGSTLTDAAILNAKTLLSI